MNLSIIRKVVSGLLIVISLFMCTSCAGKSEEVIVAYSDNFVVEHYMPDFDDLCYQAGIRP